MADFGILDILRLAACHGFATQALDASNDGAGMQWTAPKDGNIVAVYLPWGSKTGTAPTYRVGIETATATLVPNGTYLASGNAFADVTNPTANTHQKVTLGTPAVVVAGTAYWSTVRHQTGTVDASNFINLQWAATSGLNATGIPGGSALTGGTWATPSSYGILAVEYDDGTIVGLPVRQETTVSWGSGDSPVYRGTQFTPLQSFESDHLFVTLRATTAGTDFTVHIMEGANATPLQSIALTKNLAGSTGNPGIWHLPITRRTFVAGTAYTLLVQPTTTNAINTMYQVSFYDNTAAAALGAGEMSYATATALGTYTLTADDFAPIMVVPRGVPTVAASGFPLVGHGGLAA